MLKWPLYIVYPTSIDQIRNGSNVLIDNVIKTLRLYMLLSPSMTESMIVSFIAYNNEIINFKNFEGIDICDIPDIESRSSAVFTDYILNFLKKDIIKNKKNFLDKKWRTPIVVFIMDYEQKINLTSASVDWIDGCSEISYYKFIESTARILENEIPKWSTPNEPYTAMFVVNAKNNDISDKLPIYKKICRGNIVPFDENTNPFEYILS